MQKTALISVSDKQNIEVFAGGLIDLGYQIVSSGGTAVYLEKAGVPVMSVENLIGASTFRQLSDAFRGQHLLVDGEKLRAGCQALGKPLLGRRVVTLHPAVHAGILSKDNADEIAEIEAVGVRRIDLVCVDFYDVANAMADLANTRAQLLEFIDIGGPTLIRGAAKLEERIVICDPQDREPTLQWMRDGEPNRETFIRRSAAKAEFVVARYAALAGLVHLMDSGMTMGEMAAFMRRQLKTEALIGVLYVQVAMGNRA